MPTREEEAARWRAISLDSRKAAQRLLEVGCYRSSISRAYYAAYSAITSALIRQGITLGYGGNNPGHAGLPGYVLNNLAKLSLASRFGINKALRRLYSARIWADYQATPEVDEQTVLGLLRDLSRVLTVLSLNERMRP